MPSVFVTDDCDLIVDLKKTRSRLRVRIVMGDLNVKMLLTSRDSDFIKDFASRTLN